MSQINKRIYCTYILYSVQYTVHCILYTVYCIPYTVHCTVYGYMVFSRPVLGSHAEIQIFLSMVLTLRSEEIFFSDFRLG